MVDNKVLEISPEHQYSSTITMPAGKYASIDITSSNEDVLKDLRVVEYTKNGKITRVELQRLNRDCDTWVKIPRIKIEE